MIRRYFRPLKPGTVINALHFVRQEIVRDEREGLEHVGALLRMYFRTMVGASNISGEQAEWLEDQQKDHVRGAPYYPQARGRIEPWHQTLKNRIFLENHYLPGVLRQQLDAFAAHDNHRRYHESLQNLMQADICFGRGQTILKQRERIKRKTIETRRLLHRKYAAQSHQPDEPRP